MGAEAHTVGEKRGPGSEDLFRKDPLSCLISRVLQDINDSIAPWLAPLVAQAHGTGTGSRKSAGGWLELVGSASQELSGDSNESHKWQEVTIPSSLWPEDRHFQSSSPGLGKHT